MGSHKLTLLDLLGSWKGILSSHSNEILHQLFYHQIWLKYCTNNYYGSDAKQFLSSINWKNNLHNYSNWEEFSGHFNMIFKANDLKWHCAYSMHRWGEPRQLRIGAPKHCMPQSAVTDTEQTENFHKFLPVLGWEQGKQCKLS